MLCVRERKLREQDRQIELTRCTSPNAPLPITFSTEKSSADNRRLVICLNAGSSAHRYTSTHNDYPGIEKLKWWASNRICDHSIGITQIFMKFTVYVHKDKSVYTMQIGHCKCVPHKGSHIHQYYVRRHL